MIKPLASTALITLVLLSTADAADPSDWTSWRGNGRDGVVASPLPESLEGSLELVWEKPHGPSYSGPIIHKGLVFTTETVDKKYERVTAYRLADGEVAWEMQWEGSMAVPFFAAANGDWIRSTPACSDAGLVVVGMRDVMVCLNPQTGEQIWKVDFHKDMGDPLPMFGAACSPLIDGDSV
ncbi:MAG: PQQ-binding-like beta-propeller repeat protein, partial [Planctomycetota bacterium]